MNKQVHGNLLVFNRFPLHFEILLMLKRRSCWFCVSFALLAASANGQTEREIIAAASRASFEDSALSFSVPFEASIVDPPLNDEELASLIEREREGIRMSREMFKGRPEFQRKYDDALVGIEESVKRRAESHRDKKVDGVYHRAGPLLGGDSIFEARIVQGEAPPFDVFLLERRLDEKADLRSVMFDASGRFVTVSANGASLGIPDPMFLGRLPSVFYPFHFDHTLPIRLELDDSFEPSIEGEVAISLRFEESGDVGLGGSTTSIGEVGGFGRVVMNTSRGYTCPYFELSDSDGLVLKIVCEDFKQVGPSNLWYPFSSTVTSRASGGLRKTLLKIRESGMSLGEALPPELFTIEVPAGTSFMYQLGSGMQAISRCAITVDIDSLPALPDHKCLVQQIQSAPVGDSGRLPNMFLLVNLLLLLIFGFFFVYRKLSKRKR